MQKLRKIERNSFEGIYFLGRMAWWIWRGGFKPVENSSG
jgi:hypothetical protein